jgi:hypothetical protein
MDFPGFYSQQSAMSDPGEFAYLFDGFPRELVKIKKIIQGLIFHFWDGNLFGYKIPFARLLEVETRYVEKMLRNLISKEASALEISRAPDKKIIGSCRDYALLFCSVLRHQGIPARVRVAFNLFFFKDAYHDQVILEYWNSDKNHGNRAKL